MRVLKPGLTRVSGVGLCGIAFSLSLLGEVMSHGGQFTLGGPSSY